jgi:hypothetical protein
MENTLSLHHNHPINLQQTDELSKSRKVNGVTSRRLEPFMRVGPSLSCRTELEQRLEPLWLVEKSSLLHFGYAEL